MSTIDFKKAWEEALRRAILACQPESELSDPALDAVAGLPVRSGLQAGAFSIPCGLRPWQNTGTCQLK